MLYVLGIPLIIIGGVFVAGVVYSVTRLIKMRGHIVAAMVWAAITAYQTAMLLTYREKPDLIGHLTLFVAGWVMAASWKQLAEKWRGEMERQSRHPLVSRLFVQSIYGPVLLFVVVCFIVAGMQRAFEGAAQQCDLDTVRLLRRSGNVSAGTRAMEQGLMRAIAAQDEAMTSAYLAAGGAQLTWNDDEQVSALQFAAWRANTSITALLLSHCPPTHETRASLNDALRSAVSHNQPEQVRFLLENGANSESRNPSGESAWDIAAQQKEREVKLILTTYSSVPRVANP